MKPGQERDFYRKQLEQLGYQITAVNQDKADYVEYEIVKGEQTYEVQVDMDEKSRKAKKVHVSWNMWQAKGTEQALEKDKGQKTGDKGALEHDKGRKGADMPARGGQEAQNQSR